LSSFGWRERLHVEPLKAQRRLLDLEEVIKHYSLVQDFYTLHISLLLFQHLLFVTRP